MIRRSETGDQECRFLLQERSPVLPVFHDGQFQIVPWGNRRREADIPVSGWCPRESLEAGLWSLWNPQETFIPASFGWDRGVWYQIREGFSGVLIRDRNRQLRVFVLTQPATHYYAVMTRNNREPVMIGETI